MPRLRIARTAAADLLGTGVYEQQIVARAGASLPAGWTTREVVIRSLRSPLAGTHRLPMSRVARAPLPARRALGRVIHPGNAVVHRMNLELPPAPVDIITLHDVVAWKFPDESPPVPAAAEEIRRAAAVICVSHFSASEAVGLLGIDDPYVIHHGVDPRFLDAAPASAAVLAALGITPPFVMATGGASERKNLAGLAAAWSTVHRARPELTLVLTGPPHPRRQALFAHQPGVILTGMVAVELMPNLMAAAEAVVVPSLYEGFGFPALEGMAVGTIVVAAATSSLPEVVGDGALLVEPNSTSLAQGILDATSKDQEVATIAGRGRHRADHFTWERSLAAHAAVWTSVAG